MILSDRDILEALELDKLKIEPFDVKQLQPSSYDLTLSRNFWLQAETKAEGIENWPEAVIDLEHMPDMKQIGTGVHIDSYILYPHTFVLGSTVERIEIPSHLAARLEGKSSLARLGIVIHATAGYIDPGFRGHLTLELTNVGKFPLKLHPGMLIAQLTLLKMNSLPSRLYGHSDLHSRYQDQGPSPEPFRLPQSDISA